MPRSALKAAILAFAVLPFAVLGLPGTVAPLTGPARAEAGVFSPITVVTASGRHAFQVELARTPAERAQGLMDRKDLPADRGMLFDMGEETLATFWMKNTYVSLDIIFIGVDGRVVNVAARTTPLSEALVPSAAPVRYVLELLAGTAERIGLKAGDRVEHAIIAAPAP